jgi:hypothetical protein
MVMMTADAGVWASFCKSGKNTFRNVGRVASGAQDNNNYGDYNDCLEDDINKASYQLVRDLALGIVVVKTEHFYYVSIL